MEKRVRASAVRSYLLCYALTLTAQAFVMEACTAGTGGQGMRALVCMHAAHISQALLAVWQSPGPATAWEK